MCMWNGCSSAEALKSCHSCTVPSVARSSIRLGLKVWPLILNTPNCSENVLFTVFTGCSSRRSSLGMSPEGITFGLRFVPFDTTVARGTAVLNFMNPWSYGSAFSWYVPAGGPSTSTSYRLPGGMTSEVVSQTFQTGGASSEMTWNFAGPFG